MIRAESLPLATRKRLGIETSSGQRPRTTHLVGPHNADLARRGRALCNLLDEAHRLYADEVAKAATAERDYRKGRAEAHVRCPSGTVDEVVG